MTVTIILSFCILLLIAYIFDLTSSKTRIPSVILLLLLGWSLRQFTDYFDILIPDFSPFLPVLGTIGLILIVLEGSLELELNRSKLGLIRNSLIGATLPMLVMAFSLGALFFYFGNSGFKDSLTNAIPFCVISSAIAIPSVRNLSKANKEFIIYESSFSDITGVLIFNFLIINETVDTHSFLQFGLELLIITLVSFLATIFLSYLLSKIDHHVKFIPIILLVILIYTVSKIYHLPGLIFILCFGLFLGNLDEIKRIKWLEKIKPDELDKEAIKFKELTAEGAFLVRVLFFLLFGYLIKTADVLNADTFIWALAIVALIFIFRTLQLKLSRMPLQPLLFVAPRGLITILLYLSIEPSHTIDIVNDSLVIQVILLTAILMMTGLMRSKHVHLPKETVSASPESQDKPAES